MLAPLEGFGLERFVAHRSPVTALAFHSDGQNLVSGDVERNVCLWREGQLRWQHSLRGGQVWAKSRNALRMRGLAFSTSGRLIFAAGNERLEALTAREGEYVWNYQSPRAWGFLVTLPTGLAVSETGRMAACFDNATLGVWSEDGHLERWFKGNDVPDRVGFLHGGRMLVGLSPFRLSLFDVEAGVRLSYFEGNTRFVSLAVHPVLPYIACRSLESLFIFDPHTGQSVGGFEAGYGLPLMAFRPSDKSIAVSNLNQVAIKDFSGRVLQTLNLPGRRCTALAWDALGERLAIGCSDGDLVTVRVA